MIEIILSVCLMQQPDRCRELTLTMMAENATPFQCMRYGQLEASKWSAEHPGWVLKKFRCAPVGHMAKA